MQAETLDILIERAHFEPQIAHAIGTAIETEVKSMQLVTEPVFKAGMADMHREFADFRGDMRKEFAEFKGDMRKEFAEFKGDMHKEFAEFKGDMHKEFAEFKGDIRKEFADFKSEIRHENRELETRLVWKLTSVIVIGFVVLAGALTASRLIVAPS